MKKTTSIAFAATGLLLALASHAQEKLTYVTNWYAQAEHGGFYQALATGLYRQHGLDVTIRMGGPQVNILQLLGAGQADCIMGDSDLQVMVARGNGLPVVTLAAAFQKDPQVLIAHEDVKRFEDMQGKTILIASNARQGYWLWLKGRYGLKDEQTRPYTFNIQPFMADRNAVQQGYLTSEPFAIQKAGVKANTFLFADHGWPSYSTTISCLEETVKKRPKALAAFVKASMEGWKSFLANPAPAAALIRKDNPAMTEEQFAYSVARLREMAIVTGGGAAKDGIGSMDPARMRANWSFLVQHKLVDPAKVKLEDAYRLDFIRDAKVMP